MLKNIAKKILPQKTYNLLRMRPRFALLSGHLYSKVKYINSLSWKSDPDNRGDILSIVRKQAHIIDKGLQSPKRTPGHSLELSHYLKKNLEKINHEISPHTSQWATAIYNHHQSLQRGQLSERDYSNFPFENENSISYEKLLASIKERRTIRHFEEGETPTPKEIKRALTGSIWAPSSCNRQTIVNFFTCNDNLAKKCASFNKGATSISGTFAFISVCYDTRSYHLPQESLTGMIDASLGFQNSLLLFHSLGLGACVLNWSHADEHEEAELREALEIPRHCQIAFNVIIGKPKNGAPIPGKKSAMEYMVEVK
ncbi:Nitroreductase [Pseudomonas linyingensis]|uniref:Nitroreductase n=1 Tax=Pseudomonas linyingensis TaxID=915471 RepID=A0A1H6XER3_9PSED|nr:nitroreductase family protein [Pseudomonas linyingensis]SEJ25994.1 Nitroreductase [Pseudomonas linyingensis]